MPAGLVKGHSFTVVRRREPEGHNVQHANSFHSVVFGIKEVYDRRSSARRFREQNAVVYNSPTGPCRGPHASRHQRLVSSVRWDLPDFRIRMWSLGVVNQLSIRRFERGMATELCHLHRYAAF